MVYHLRPMALEELGLIGAVDHRLEAVERRAGVDARLVVEGVSDLPPELEEELFGIAQEALNNALKHASASSVAVTIRVNDENVVLEIRDDGLGFDADACLSDMHITDGFGLFSLRERLENLGGTLTIDSQPGHGAKVTVTVPV